MQNGSLIGTIYFCGDIPELETISNTIIALSNDESCAAGGRGVCATDSYDGTDYRYRGAEVDNFVSFNGDMYRIIGVFDENTHGVTGEYLVKLIQANVSYNYSWGGYNSSATSGTYYDYKNDWTGNTTGIKSNANVLLNEYFYNKTNTSSTYGVCTNWTYYSSDTNYRTNDCSNIVGYGIDSSFRNYIEDVTWYLKGYNGSEYSKQNFYLCERGITTDTTNCMSGNSGAYNVSITGKIGLMYVSDYMYASGYYSTLDITTASSYYYGNNNWLFQGDEWTITPQADSDGRVFYFDDTGDVYTYNSVNAIGFRPTFYLKSTIKVSGGDGTFENPYTLIL